MEETPRSINRPFSVKMGKRLALRLYPDHRPGNLEIAPLMKGLVMVLDGVELVEEGVGLGVPVVKYVDKTFFSGTAETSVLEDNGVVTLTKLFTLDTVSKKQMWKGPIVNDRLYSSVHKIFAKVYLGHKKARPASDKLMQLRRTVGVQTRFVKVKPRGKIQVTYQCRDDEVEVGGKILELQRSGCEEILVLNEQGASFFRRHTDDEMELFDGEIGPWDRVQSNEASLTDSAGRMGFALKTPLDAVMHRGLERVKGRLSWAGLSYSLKPNVQDFRYTIKLTAPL